MFELFFVFGDTYTSIYMVYVVMFVVYKKIKGEKWEAK